jgi:membrane associated rhomboid family serine protease
MNNFNYRRPGFLKGGFSFFPPVIKYLLVSNALIFVIFNLVFSNLRIGSTHLDAFVMRYFALNPVESGYFLPWQVFTYMFMHADFMHLFFNMFALWMFGMELENIWGPRKFIFYYFMCGLGAAAANLIIAPLVSQIGPTVGASGAIYGVLVAFGYLFPDRQIYIYFLIPVKARILIMFYIAFEVFAVASQSSAGIAHVAHLGGALIGLIYLIAAKRNKKFDFFSRSFKKPEYTYSAPGNGTAYKKPGWAEKLKKKEEVADAKYTEFNLDNHRNDMRRREKEAQEKIDAILDKLSEKGYQGLTDDEKKVLFEESKKLR